MPLTNSRHVQIFNNEWRKITRLQAVSMPQAFDSAWSAVGGGPADLTFPDNFLGHWVAESTLSKIETPMGLEFIPNPLVSLILAYT